MRGREKSMLKIIIANYRLRFQIALLRDEVDMARYQRDNLAKLLNDGASKEEIEAMLQRIRIYQALEQGPDSE